MEQFKYIFYLFSSIALLFICIIALLNPSKCDKTCITVKGSLICHQDPTKQQNVEIGLWEDDPIWDDSEGFTTSDENGEFVVQGCPYDSNFLGVTNLPEPYVYFRHSCGGTENVTRIEITDLKAHIQNVGVVPLDGADYQIQNLTIPMSDAEWSRRFHAKMIAAMKERNNQNKKNQMHVIPRIRGFPFL
ncbi:transthyretin-like family domain-containing protein [Ditylenchus destructor]|nr:transthyretin-like family domain-containing protein [Ditylenchus destructor]